MDVMRLQETMAQGFNTYYNNSVLTHVLMPQGIALSLSFKFLNTGKVLRESLIGRLGENDESIHPGPRSYDGSYTELSVSCCGHEILVQTAAEKDKLYLLITPLKNPSRRPPVLLVSAAVLWNKPGYTKLEDGRLFAVTPDRSLEITSDGKRVRQMNTGLTNPYIACEVSRPVAVAAGTVKEAAELADFMADRKKRLLDECARYGDLAEVYNAMRTCLAWDTIYEGETGQICSPVSRLWNITWGGYVLFEWDTYFSSMLAMPENKELAYANAIAITHQKTETGFVPNFAGADDYKSRDRSQPPMGSLAVRELYRVYREEWFVAYLFDDLLSWNRWFAGHRRLTNGLLCWGSDPYPEEAGRYWEQYGVNQLAGAVLESGQDNSPLYDDVPFDKSTHLICLADVGLTGLYILDCENLAELANLIGRPEAAELRERAELSKEGMEELWDEEFGLYLNKRTDTGELSRRISPVNFYALFSDRVSPERIDRMMREHFFNPREFYGEFIIPAIARNDPAYHEQNYWRGRIWAPLNYLVYIALRRHKPISACREACRILSEKSRNLILREWTEKGHVHENFNSDTGIGCDVPNSDKFYHWGGLLSLIALIEAGYAAGPENPL
jgi:hypothetical protein